MARPVRDVSGLVIETNISPCAHICRYCHVADRTYSSIPIDRLIALFDRFVEWKTAIGRHNLEIYFSLLGPSYNYDIETMTTLMAFQRRINRPWRRIFLGGLKMLPEDEMRRWLIARRDLGITSIGASMAGHGAVHDRWNGRNGDFDFMAMTQRLAREIGMEVHQWLFVVKSTLPILDEAARILDALVGPPTRRYARLFLAAGYGAYYENERIVEGDMDRLPDWVRDLLRSSERWELLPEREWIDLVRQDPVAREEAERENFPLHLHVNDRNIEQIEETSCEQMFEDVERRTRAVYFRMPSHEELLETCADRDGDKIYDIPLDIERAWMDRYLDKHPMDLDWSLTPHLVGKSRSKHPPSLVRVENAPAGLAAH